jgi:hypothetical protein
MQRLNDLPLSCKLQHLRASVSTCADTSRSLRAVSTGYASRPPACRAHLGRRAACPEGAPWVRVPASGVPCAPRTVAPQVSTRHARHPVCSDLRRRRVALDLLLASHSTLTELEQREIELLLQTQAWDEPPPPLGAEVPGRRTARLDPPARAARADQQAGTAHGSPLAWEDLSPGHGHGHSHSHGLEAGEFSAGDGIVFGGDGVILRRGEPRFAEASSADAAIDRFSAVLGGGETPLAEEFSAVRGGVPLTLTLPVPLTLTLTLTLALALALALTLAVTLALILSLTRRGPARGGRVQC